MTLATHFDPAFEPTLTTTMTPACTHPLADVLDDAVLDANVSLRDRRRIASVDLDVLAEEVHIAVLHGLRPTPMEIFRLADQLTAGPHLYLVGADDAGGDLPDDPQPEAAAWALERMARETSPGQA